MEQMVSGMSTLGFWLGRRSQQGLRFCFGALALVLGFCSASCLYAQHSDNVLESMPPDGHGYLFQGQHLVSANGLFVLLIEENQMGLYQRDPKTGALYPMWGTIPLAGGHFLAMQHDGNLVLYRGTPQANLGVIWTSRTPRQPNSLYHVVLTDEGDLRVRPGPRGRPGPDFYTLRQDLNLQYARAAGASGRSKWYEGVLPWIVLGPLGWIPEAWPEINRLPKNLRRNDILGLTAMLFGAPQTVLVQQVIVTPTLAAWIRDARDRLRARAQPVPDPVKREIRKLIGDSPPINAVLDRATYVVSAGQVALPSVLIREFDANAVTLDNVIVFADGRGTSDLSLWAHELYHVFQYSQWHIETFADRYTRDFNRVEDPAYELQNRVAAARP